MKFYRTKEKMGKLKPKKTVSFTCSNKTNAEAYLQLSSHLNKHTIILLITPKHDTEFPVPTTMLGTQYKTAKLKCVFN